MTENIKAYNVDLRKEVNETRGRAISDAHFITNVKETVTWNG